MAEVVVNNSYYNNKLNNLIDEFYSLDYDNMDYATISGDLDNGEYYCSREYLNDAMSREHAGFPDAYYNSSISNAFEKNPNKWKFFFEYYKYEFPPEIGAKHNALLNYYPPGGFIGWHTNWNASAYQMLFTYSLDGNGYFNYLDNKTNEIVTIPDKKGWQCRWFYFGEKNDPDNHCWHSAYTSCDRFTMAVKFDDLNYLHDVIEDLTSNDD